MSLQIPDTLIERLKEAQRVCIITGAGISAESGVPTFRGKDGLWRQYRAEELATPQAFARDPKLVWEWYNWRRSLIYPLKPNPAHEAVTAMDSHYPDFLLITQNVDGLHRKAGTRRMVEVHGNIWRVRCTREGTISERIQQDLGELPPVCEKCGAILRPDVVWFGESLPLEALNRSIGFVSACDLMIVIGTSAVVYPVAGFPWTAKQKGATVIEINAEQTPITEIADYSMIGKAGEIMPLLVKGLSRK